MTIFKKLRIKLNIRFCNNNLMVNEKSQVMDIELPDEKHIYKVNKSQLYIQDY